MTNVVGLTGKKGAGKDTFASILVNEYGYTRIAFADALYREVREAYGISNDVLSNRETKETPLPELALLFCADSAFVQVAAMHLRIDGQSMDEVLAAPRSPRVIMQLWGTEYRRKACFESYWRDIVFAAITSAPAGSKFVITDVRFKDEAETVLSVNGEVIRITRPMLELSDEAKATLRHPSEVEMDDYEPHHTIENREGAFAQLEAAARYYFS